MRMQLRRSSDSGKQRSMSDKKDSRRRSWHVETSAETPGNRRSSHSGFLTTWHLHSSNNHCDGDFEIHHDHKIASADDCQQEQPKRFSFASHIQQKPETNANSAINRENTDRTVLSLALSIQQESSSVSTSSLHDENNNANDNNKTESIQNTKHRTGSIWNFFFPGCLSWNGPSPPRRSGATQLPPTPTKSATTRSGFSLATIQVTVQVARTMYGEDGLRAAGFEFRRIPCPEHHQQQQEPSGACSPMAEGHDGVNCDMNLESINATLDDTSVMALVEPHEDIKRELPVQQADGGRHLDLPMRQVAAKSDSACSLCLSRLFHIPSNTRIDKTNRKQFIADGDMYDAIAKLCQENAHEVMIRQHGLVWVTVCQGQNDPDGNGRNFLKQGQHEPIRALVNAENPMVSKLEVNSIPMATDEQRAYYSQRPTLLIVTGKGIVRAGIFSREHLLISGIESSTALPFIHHARVRKLNIVILDPNARGDCLGYVTFTKSMEKLLPSWGEQLQSVGCSMRNCDLYILSHSTSGSHLVRYLSEDIDHKFQRRLDYIRAIAFTDSTHDIEAAWVKRDAALIALLESDASVYFRRASANMSEKLSLLHAGQESPKDERWRRRFGNIRTCWAGTKEHSLTNWYARSFIWEHFDRFSEPESRHSDEA